MSEDAKKRWLVKDSEGRVRGPFYTDEILNRIGKGEISGEEMISLYPSTNWIPISNDPQFYDLLLETLDQSVELEVASENSKKQNYIEPEEPEEFIEDRPKVKTTHNKEQNSEKTKAQQSNTKQSETQNEGPKVNRVERVGGTEGSSLKNEPSIIELKKVKKLIKKAKIKKSTGPTVVLLIFIIGLMYLFISDSSQGSERIHLIAPRKGQAALSPEQIKIKVAKAVAHYEKDQFSSYMAAQAELVQILEGDPKNAGVIALTCLTYLELWPYAFQDSQDLQTISYVNQLASKVDPAGVEAATCRVVDLMVSGRNDEARGTTEMVLDTVGRSTQPPIAFYYFKAIQLAQQKEYLSSANYAQSAQQLWPRWIRAHSFSASMLERAGKFSEAISRYRQILSANSKHKVAQIELGIIEAIRMKNVVEGEKLIRMGLSNGDKAPNEVLARGNLALAELNLERNNTADALKFAQLAYSLSASNARAKEIILKIGGEKKLKSTKLADGQLLYEGDELVREGDCNAAQAYYKAAYDLNNKNALAAMKAAECLWSLSLSKDAMTWLNNAIQADPNLIDAYVLLADYYARRHNYEAAGKILTKARKQMPNSYKVYRGIAAVELRRNNVPAAIDFANKAIQFYEADVESYVILAKAQLLNRETTKAFESASKAVEIDANNRQAQVAYAEALVGARGSHVGIDYMNRLVNTYPTITEYRLALGRMYAKDQSYTTAQQVLEQVIRIEDKPKEAYLELGKILQMQSRFDAAKDAYFQAAKLDPADVEPIFLAGQLYLEAKQPSEAGLQFQRVLRVNPDFPLVNFYIGKAALQMGSVEEALKQANIEKNKNPNLADPYILAADAYTEMRQYSACAGEYRKAVELRPANSQMYVKMARCYRMSGNIDAALSMINQAGSQESGNPEVWKEQGAIYELKQEAVKAIEAYNQYLVLAPNAIDRAQVEARINALGK